MMSARQIINVNQTHVRSHSDETGPNTMGREMHVKRCYSSKSIRGMRTADQNNKKTKTIKVQKYNKSVSIERNSVK